MTSIARKLLDELMGTDRNKPLYLRGPKRHRFTSPDVCKFHLIDFCPFSLFQNTKSDVGNCPYKIHDELIKDEFLRDGESWRREYESKFVHLLEDLVQDLERKLRRGKERLEAKDPSFTLISPENDEIEEKKALITAQIKEMLRRVEELGDEGRIGEAQDISCKAERLKEELDKLKSLDLDNPAFRIERKMEQCQTCGAMLIVNDAPLRIQSHYEGKQHNGWVQVRQTLEEWKMKAPDLFSHRQSSSSSRMDSRPTRPSYEHHDRNHPDHHYHDRHKSGARRGEYRDHHRYK